MNMYNLLEYSDIHSDSTASLYHFKRQEKSYNNAPAINDLTTANSASFKCKSGLINVDSIAVAANVNPNIPLAIDFGEMFKLLCLCL